MIRAFTAEPLAPGTADRLLTAASRAPSAGFSQGYSFLALEGAEQSAPFWRLLYAQAAAAGAAADDEAAQVDALSPAPLVLVPMASKDVYLDRYAEPDKAGLGLERAENWRVPFWLVDTSFATMAMLLAATDAGLGALFFGLGGGESALRDHLGVPPGYDPIGAVSLGWPAGHDAPSPSLARGRRVRSEVVHYGRWSPSGGPPAPAPPDPAP